MSGNPEDLAAQMRFKASPAKCIAAAKGGSKADITCLADASSCLTRLQTRDFLRALCVHWKEPVPNFDPKDNLEQSDASCAKKTELALTSLHALVSFDRHFVKDPTLGPVLQNSWPLLWKWIQYFYRQKGKTKGQIKAKKRITKEVMLILLMLVGSISYATNFQNTLLEDANLIEFVIGLWMKEDTSSPFTKTNQCYATQLLLRFYNMFYIQALKGDVFVSRVLQSTYGKSSLIVDRILKPLQSVNKISPENVVEVAECARIMEAFMAQEDNPAMIAIFEKNGVATAARLFSMFAKLSTASSGITRSVYQGLDACSLVIFLGTQNKGAPTWVLRAIRAGFLEAIADAGPLFKPDSLLLNKLKDIIREIFPNYLVYRSVLEAVINSVNQLIKDKKEPKIAAGLLKDEWTQFMSTLIERSASKAMFDQQTFRHIITCSTCGKGETQKGLFQACSQCKSELYCSRECQTMAWKRFDHKAECKGYAGMNEDGRRIKSLDKKFISFLIEEDLIRHYSSLCALAERRSTVADSSEADRMYTIDYTYVPPRLDVQCLKDLTEANCSLAQERLCFERFMAIAQVSRGWNVMCRATLRAGPMYRPTLVFVPANLNSLRLGKKLAEATQPDKLALRPGQDIQGNELKTNCNSAEILLGRVYSEVAGKTVFSEDGETVLERIERQAVRLSTRQAI